MKKNRFSILYVEDEEEIRKKYKKLFQFYFENVYEANDSDEALKLYNSHKPDVAILDINLPKKNGLEVAREIRNDNKDIVLIMLTAYSDKKKLLEAIELNLLKYLIKPIKTLDLENILIKTIDRLKKKEQEESTIILSGGFKWSLPYNELYSSTGEMIKLTKKEILLFKLFCENKNHTFSNDEIINYVWDELDEYNANKLRIVFSKLKTKLSYNLFQSIYNVGYKLKYLK